MCAKGISPCQRTPKAERFERCVGATAPRSKLRPLPRPEAMTHPLKDYYRVLGVEEGCDAEAVKRAFRAQARTCHPDRAADEAAAERFKAVREAYEVLGDPDRRKRYDRLRHSAVAFGKIRVAFGTEGATGVGEVFERVFGGEACKPQGLDVCARIQLSFDQALRGGKVEVRGADGEVARIPVPKGTPDGLTVRVRGRGRHGTNGQTGRRGDLLVTFRVQPHPRFRREGRDLHAVERVSAVEAMLGAERSITDAYGRTAALSIPPGVQPGGRLRIPGHGVVTPNGTGDLVVEVAVEVPRALDAAQRERLRQAAEDLGLL